MTAEIIHMRRGTPDEVLDEAKGRLDRVLILGWGTDGERYCRASTNLSDGGDILWLLRKFEAELLAGEYEGE